MKTYIADIIPKIQRFSQKLDNLTLLTNQHWVVVNEIISSKTVYIFRVNGELLIVINGKVSKAKWEYLGNKSILIDNNNESYLFKHGFFDENILALKVDSKEEYAFLVNENKYDLEINSIERVIGFLNSKYLDQSLKSIPNISEVLSGTNSDTAVKSPFQIDDREIDLPWTIIIIVLIIAIALVIVSNTGKIF